MKHLFLTLLLPVISPTAAVAENTVESNKLHIAATGTTMTATLVDNSSAAALKDSSDIAGARHLYHLRNNSKVKVLI